MLSKFANHIGPNHVTIFLFHGVIEKPLTKVRNYTNKHILREDFQNFLSNCVETGGTPITMDDLIAHKEMAKPLPSKAFVITFDDGFLNNLTVAAPVLSAAEIPATFYVSTDFIDRNRMSWIDRVEIVIEDCDKGELILPWGSRSFHDTQSKKDLLDDIRLNVKSNSDIIADDFASDVQRQLGFEEIWASPHPLDQKMTWAQVKELDNLPGMTVGGHSHSHAMLAFLDDEQLDDEISTSIRLLKEKANITSKHYSYPEGQAEHYDERVISLLKAAGIECCPTAIEGVNDIEEDLFHLKRVMVQ